MAKNNLVVVDKITKVYGDIAVVDNISFAIAKGSIVAMIGPNGAGKSTIAKMIMGLILPTAGTITIDGKKPSDMRTLIGYVPQRFNLNPKIPLTVKEFFMLSLHVAEKHEYENVEIIEKRFAEVGVANVMDKQLSQLSGGQLQRVLIARALLSDKKLLILDEPVAGLDIEGRQSIHELLKDLNQKNEVTIVLISHELDTVFKYADNVVCINHRMLCQGKPKEILTEKVLNEMYGMRHQAHYHHGCTHK